VPRTAPPGLNSEPITLQLRLEAMRLVPLSQTANLVAAKEPPRPSQKEEADSSSASVDAATKE
jgi:hypothetical protein